MRQGGMKPKSHSSGVYWVRAGSKGGGKKGKQSKTKHQVGIDTDGDGIADTYGEIVETSAPTEMPRISGDVWAFVVAIIFCIVFTAITL